MAPRHTFDSSGNDRVNLSNFDLAVTAETYLGYSVAAAWQIGASGYLYKQITDAFAFFATRCRNSSSVRRIRMCHRAQQFQSNTGPSVNKRQECFSR